MKETAAHIATPVLHKSAEPFFQRSAGEGREDNAFFSQVQAKLTVGQRDDPFEKEADAMADKVVSKNVSHSAPPEGAQSAVSSVGGEPAAATAVTPGAQAKFESAQDEDRNERKEEDNADDRLQRSPVVDDGSVQPQVQRMYREVEEGDKISRLENDSPNTVGMTKRDAVIAMAKTMLGKIKAKQPGTGGERYGADYLWEIFKLAAPGVWTEETVKNLGQKLPSWCGIFAVWAHKKAGVDIGNWQMGKGVSAFGTLKQTSSPQPGDIGYIDQPYQHHCIVTKVGSNIESIDGNSGLFSEVVENTRPKSAFSGFFTAFSGGDGGSVNKKEAGNTVQRDADGNAADAPAHVESALASSKGGGAGLPDAVKSEMESGLGADFNNVRVHTDSNSVKMSQDLNAHAFTHGSDIYFNSNKYDTGSSAGKHLLAHELTHTIQQGASGVKKKEEAPEISRSSKKIQRKTAKASEVDVEVAGDVYEITFTQAKLRHTIDLGKKNLEMPEISLPKLKQRNQNLYNFPLLSVRGRGETLQVDNWVNAVRAAVDAKVFDFVKKDNPNVKPEDVLFYKLAKRKSFNIIGNVRKIQENSYLPKWNRFGEPNNHQVDHIVEYQLGGEDQPGTKPSNYELLDAKANMSSGNAIRKERYDRINESIGYFTDLNKDTDPKTHGKFPNLPTAEDVKSGYINKFGKVHDWNLPFNGRGEVYWTYSEIVEKAAHLNQLEKMTQAEINDIQGSAAEALIYVGEGLGTPKRLKIPFAGKQANFFLGMDLENFTLNATPPVPGTAAGSLEFKLNQKFTKRLKAGDNLTFDLMPVEGRVNTFFIKTTKQFNKNMFKKFEGLSPVTVNDLEIDETLGLVLTGTITCDTPLLKDLSIDFYVSGDDMGFTTVVNADIIRKYFPKPFKVNSVNLEISYSSKDNVLSLLGDIDFEIEKLGAGKVKGGKKGEGFIVSGDFKFDKSLFDGEIHFGYEDDKWSIGGSAKMDSKKIKAIKSASIHFDYKDDTLTAGGKAYLTVPGIKQIDIDTTVGKDGNFTIEAKIQLSDIPHIKGGEGTVKISRDGTGKEGSGDWDLSITGRVMPDIDYQGLKVTEADISYSKGAFDFSFDATYDRNRITGTFKIGITNKPVSVDGKTADGEGTPNMKFYGALKLKVNITDEVDGEIDSVLKPDGDITLDGKIELKEDKKIFDIPSLNENIFTLDKNIPIASCVVVTLSLHVGGAVDLYANVDPLSVKKGSNVTIGNLSLKNYKDPQIGSKLILGSHLQAGVKLSLEVGLDASLLGVLHAQVGGKGTLNFVALAADATGILDLGWSPDGGFKINEASVSLEMMSKLVASLDAYAKVFVDLWLTTINIWSHTWPVAKEEFELSFFDKKKIKIAIPVGGNGGKMQPPDMSKNLADVKKSATVDKVHERTSNKLNGIGQTDEDKQAEVNELTKKQILAEFNRPDRFEFNRSNNYLETRYGLYDYLKGKAGLDPKIDLTYIDSEIIRCEREEYDAFTTYILGEKSFNDNTKSLIIEDFIINHPSLGSTEVTNLRSLEPAASAPDKPPLKDRAKNLPKKTPDQQPAPVKKPVQKKAMPGAVRSQDVFAGAEGGVFPMNTGQHGDPVWTDAGLPDWHTDTMWKESSHPDGMEDDDFGPGDWDTSEKFTDTSDNFENILFMRPYSRTRRPLQQQRTEANKSPFFTGPDKKEKASGSAFFQAKLDVGSVDDPLEKEADKVADKVVTQLPKTADKKEGADKSAEAAKPAPEEKKEKTDVQKKSHETEKEEEYKTVVTRKENNSGSSGSRGKNVEGAIAEKNGKGNNMPVHVLEDMQSAFGSDFSDVRIHNDSEAAEISNELDAQAFTTGKDIYFNSGKFDPESSQGAHLLAHELTHVMQQNKDTIRRDPKKSKDPEKSRAQDVRDNYQKALKKKMVDWREVALYFNAFNTDEMNAKKSQLSANQLFLLHQGAVYAAGVGPWSAAALNTTPVPGMDSAVAASIDDQILHDNYQPAIDLMVDYLDKNGVINRKLLWGGTFKYVSKANMKGEGRVLAPGFDKDGHALPTASQIGMDAFGEDKGVPFLYSTIIHEYQHVQQMQRKDESKSSIPGQSDDEATHLQQEVEAYGTELLHAKETGLYNNPEQVEDTWNRLQARWDQLTDSRKQDLKDLYKNAYAAAKDALGKKSYLVYTPVK